jgi:hypothetical protein
MEERQGYDMFTIGFHLRNSFYKYPGVDGAAHSDFRKISEGVKGPSENSYMIFFIYQQKRYF